MNKLITLMLLFATANPSWAGSQDYKFDCERILSAKYSIFPLHRKLFQVRKTLGKELKLIDYSILQDTHVGYVGINMRFPGKRMLFYFDYGVKPALIRLNLKSRFAKLVGKDVYEFDIYDPELSLVEMDYYDKLIALALSLVVPAAFPFEQDVVMEVQGTTPVVFEELVQNLADGQHPLTVPLFAFHSLGRLGYHKVLEEPKVSTRREIRFEGGKEISHYEHLFNVRLGFKREY